MSDESNEPKKPSDESLTEEERLLRLLGRRAPRQPIVQEPDSGAITDDERKRDIIKDIMFIASQQNYYATFADDDVDKEDGDD